MGFSGATVIEALCSVQGGEERLFLKRTTAVLPRPATPGREARVKLQSIAGKFCSRLRLNWQKRQSSHVGVKLPCIHYTKSQTPSIPS